MDKDSKGQRKMEDSGGELLPLCMYVCMYACMLNTYNY